jgi:tRNA(Ile)-lysidine synthase
VQLTSDRAALQARLIAATQALVGDDPTARFGVAVSGGPDSMALLYLANRAFAGRVLAITIDHGLRPASADEAAMVARWCAGQGIVHHVATPDSLPTGNIQAWARTQRYAQIEQWRALQGIDWIMTAHHADDQLETLLMRLNRGSGVGGLAGVRGRTGTVIRPLLGVRKAVLQQLVDDEALPHVHDPSNADLRFDRASLRAALAGADWLNPEAATRSASALAEAEAALDWTVRMLAADHIRRDGAQWRLDRTDLPREYLRRLTLHMLHAAAPDAALPRGDALDRAISAAQVGGQANLGDWLLQGGPVWTLFPAPPRTRLKKVPQPGS